METNTFKRKAFNNLFREKITDWVWEWVLSCCTVVLRKKTGIRDRLNSQTEPHWSSTVLPALLKFTYEHIWSHLLNLYTHRNVKIASSGTTIGGLWKQLVGHIYVYCQAANPSGCRQQQRRKSGVLVEGATNSVLGGCRGRWLGINRRWIFTQATTVCWVVKLQIKINYLKSIVTHSHGLHNVNYVTYITWTCVC